MTMTTSADISLALKQPTPMPGRAEIIVRWTVALLLLVAAALKADQIATEPLHGTGFQASRPLAILVVEYEAILGFWLLSGFYVGISRGVTIVTFAAFFCFAAHEAWQGAPSCNCFGNAPISPWITAGLDMLIIAGLLATPVASLSVGRFFLGRLCFFAFGAILAVAAIPTMLGFRPLGLIRGPDLMPDADFFTFGTIDPVQARNLDHEFRIENRGSRPIQLLKSSSTCSCTVADLPKDPIQPGGYTLVRVSARWPGRLGVQREQVIVETDSPTRSSLALRITANIVVAAVHWPDVVNFGDVVEGQSLSKTLTLAPGAGQKEFRVLSSFVDDPLLKIDKGPEAATGGEKAWTVTLTAKSVKDRTRSIARFTLDLPGGKVMTVPVVYTILPAVRATPRSLLFSSRQPGARSIVVDSPTPLDELKVISSDLDPAAFDLRTVASTASGSLYHLTIEVKFTGTVEHLSNATLVLSVGSFSSRVPIVLMP